MIKPPKIQGIFGGTPMIKPPKIQGIFGGTPMIKPQKYRAFSRNPLISYGGSEKPAFL